MQSLAAHVAQHELAQDRVEARAGANDRQRGPRISDGRDLELRQQAAHRAWQVDVVVDNEDAEGAHDGSSRRTSIRDPPVTVNAMPRREAPDPLSGRIGERIRELRLEAGLTLEKLAYESELGSKGHLSDLERGLVQPTVGTLHVLAKHLGVHLFEFMTFREEGPRAELADLSRRASARAIERALRVLTSDRAATAEPFEIVPRPRKQGAEITAVPLVDLTAAAGAFREGRAVETRSWVIPHSNARLRKGMFVAVVRGHSMEPKVPDGSYCLFAGPVRGIAAGRTVLVEHRTAADPETGGSYSVKRLSVETHRGRRRVRLLALNPEFAPIEVADPDSIRVVAELVSVLGRRKTARRRGASRSD